jgi:trans-2,3-dihydro-3-hydroxyanthranilate isomerase
MHNTMFYITDVFARQKHSGNQLATFFDCKHLSDKEMQAYAREINFSETTFVTCSDPIRNGYDVRIFTPLQEVDFAGHPTLGTAWLIRKHLLNNKVDKISLNLKVGQITVTFDGDKGFMKQVQPVFGKTFSAEDVARVLGIRYSDIDLRFPIQEVSTGLPFLLVPIRNNEVLAQAGVRHEFLPSFGRTTIAKGFMLFSPEAHEANQQLAVRAFAPRLGIIEDPATGSATGALAAWLLRYDYYGKDEISITTGQGYEMGRPSELFIQASYNDGLFDINVGGKTFEIAHGEWGSAD